MVDVFEVTDRTVAPNDAPASKPAHRVHDRGTDMPFVEVTKFHTGMSDYLV